MKPQEKHTRTLRITEMKLEIRVWIIIVFLHLLVCKVNYDDTDDQSDGEEEETNTTSNDYTDDATNHMSKKGRTKSLRYSYRLQSYAYCRLGSTHPLLTSSHEFNITPSSV